jgi:hypothetical protein
MPKAYAIYKDNKGVRNQRIKMVCPNWYIVANVYH